MLHSARNTSISSTAAREAPFLNLDRGAQSTAKPNADSESLATVEGVRGGAYDRAKELLTCLPVNYSPATLSHNLDVIRRIAEVDSVSALLSEILESRGLLSEIAGRSYRHTNHFDKIVLIDTGARFGYRLTLHLWIPPYTEAEIVDEQIHDHRFSFWSKILVGTMVFQDFVRDASGLPFNEFQYIPEKLGCTTVGNFYIDVGESPLLESGRSGGCAGHAYHLPYSQIHRVVLPMESMTCTLVLRGPRQKNYASVFSTSGKRTPSGNTMFTSSDLASRLVLLLGKMKENGL